MTDEVNQKNEGAEQAGMTEETGNVASGDVKSYSQDELNGMFAERARQAVSAWLKKQGFESVADAVALVKEARERKEAEMSELQKSQSRIEALQKQLEQAGEERKAIALQGDVMVKSGKLGIIDPEVAYKLLDKSAIEYGDDGAPKNVEALLVELVKNKPYLAGGGSSPANPAKNRDDSKKLTWTDAIKEALEGNN